MIMDLKTYYVDFHELPWYYGTAKVYANSMAEAKEEARALWGRMCCKECRRLPNYTQITEHDPSAKMFDSMIEESRRSGIPATDMY
jgi:hypothetical protein